jgi:hypothetical protein
MFRENPTYIVAGEIVRTSRTWAHSVSPLRRAWLERISPELARQLIPHGGGRQRERKRDFTNNVKIGRELFELRVEKGKKKTVLLPWERISRVVAAGSAQLLPHYHKLRGKLIIGDHEVCSGMRLATILKLVPRIRPTDIMQEIPEGTFSLPEDFRTLEGSLSHLLKLCRLPKRKKQLGFLALHTDGQGNYWFQGTRNFVTALNESLYSLEVLADERQRHSSGEINKVYRELARELEAL